MTIPYNYIAIAGNIGAGKTTLATRMAQHFNARLILEQFEDNSFLPQFYEDPARYAFPLELSFLADRFQPVSYTHLKNVVKANQIANHFALNPGENSLFKTIPMVFNFFTKVLLIHSLTDKSDSAIMSKAKLSAYTKQDYICLLYTSRCV